MDAVVCAPVENWSNWSSVYICLGLIVECSHLCFQAPSCLLCHITYFSLVLFSVLGRGRRVGVFISKGGTGILFQILVTVSQESTLSEELMVQLHSLLAKVGPNGKIHVKL